MRDHRATILTEFFRLFFREFWKPVWERCIDGVLVFAAFIYAAKKGKLSVEAWTHNAIDVLIPFICAMCIVILIHLVRTGVLLNRNISQENASLKPTKHISSILQANGKPVEQWTLPSVIKHSQLKILGIVVVLSIFPIVVLFFSWNINITQDAEEPTNKPHIHVIRIDTVQDGSKLYVNVFYENDGDADALMKGGGKSELFCPWKEFTSEIDEREFEETFYQQAMIGLNKLLPSATEFPIPAKSQHFVTMPAIKFSKDDLLHIETRLACMRLRFLRIQMLIGSLLTRQNRAVFGFKT
jgi:hypothetical protein